mmetsp:Transcript_37174/g.73141  ORF Transcript_37174/g.73141 Transcript_37174/m.73141 type:complete len:177 (-) Transcript_37174:262-792(-)
MVLAQQTAELAAYRTVPRSVRIENSDSESKANQTDINMHAGLDELMKTDAQESKTKKKQERAYCIEKANPPLEFKQCTKRKSESEREGRERGRQKKCLHAYLLREAPPEWRQPHRTNAWRHQHGQRQQDDQAGAIYSTGGKPRTCNNTEKEKCAHGGLISLVSVGQGGHKVERKQH